MRPLHFHAILLLSLLLTACSTTASSQPSPADQPDWLYSDLRLVDPVDAPDPVQDIIAVYVRQSGSGPVSALLRSSAEPQYLEIRLDMLDLDYSPGADIYLALDYRPGGQTHIPGQFESDLAWDTLLFIPAHGAIQALDDSLLPQSNMAMRILRDPNLDALTIRLNSTALQDRSYSLQAQAFTCATGQPELSDRTSPFSLHGSPPAPANLQFAFWNTYPALTPAQALRRWDGAHTGPLGGRHGLYNLLRTARNHDIPIALLDLKTPASLSALDYAGGLPLIQEMYDQGLLLLPDVIPFTYPYGSQLYETVSGLPAGAYTAASESSRTSAATYGLPASQFLYAPLSAPNIRGYTQLIAPTTGDRPFANLITHPAGRALLLPHAPLLQGEERQADLQGPSLSVRRLLVDSAINADQHTTGQSTFLLLGGDLAAVEWGDPQIARAAFNYLSSHPWVRILQPFDLLILKPEDPSVGPGLRSAHLRTMPDPPVVTHQPLDASNPLVGEAWLSYLTLLSPVYPVNDELLAMRINYSEQIQDLLAAAHWSESPQTMATCDLAPDQSSQPLCALASENILALFEPGEGAMTHLFSLSEGEPHQWVAPTSQFLSGMSDPASWDLSAGWRADPSVIPGAFADPGAPFSASVRDGGLVFTRPGLEKTFQLTPNGLLVIYHSQIPQTVQVPLAVDPWLRNTPNWGDSYTGSPIQDGWDWGWVDGPYLEITTDSSLAHQDFTDTRHIMGSVENPNYDYPPGHYLPFPVSLLEIDIPGTTDVQIELELHP